MIVMTCSVKLRAVEKGLFHDYIDVTSIFPRQGMALLEMPHQVCSNEVSEKGSFSE